MTLTFPFPFVESHLGFPQNPKPHQDGVPDNQDSSLDATQLTIWVDMYTHVEDQPIVAFQYTQIPCTNVQLEFRKMKYEKVKGKETNKKPLLERKRKRV